MAAGPVGTAPLACQCLALDPGPADRFLGVQPGPGAARPHGRVLPPAGAVLGADGGRPAGRHACVPDRLAGRSRHPATHARRRRPTRPMAPAGAGHPWAAADLGGAGPDPSRAKVSGWLGAVADPGSGAADRRRPPGLGQPVGAGLATAGVDRPDQLSAVSLALALDGLCQSAGRRAGRPVNAMGNGLAQCPAGGNDLCAGRDPHPLRPVALAWRDGNFAAGHGQRGSAGRLDLASERL